jgi:hypothetical protein
MPSVVPVGYQIHRLPSIGPAGIGTGLRRVKLHFASAFSSPAPVLSFEQFFLHGIFFFSWPVSCAMIILHRDQTNKASGLLG